MLTPKDSKERRPYYTIGALGESMHNQLRLQKVQIIERLDPLVTGPSFGNL